MGWSGSLPDSIEAIGAWASLMAIFFAGWLFGWLICRLKSQRRAHREPREAGRAAGPQVREPDQPWLDLALN